MDQKPKLGKNFGTHKPYPGWIAPIFYMAITRQQLELESCSNPQKTHEVL